MLLLRSRGGGRGGRGGDDLGVGSRRQTEPAEVDPAAAVKSVSLPNRLSHLTRHLLVRDPCGVKTAGVLRVVSVHRVWVHRRSVGVAPGDRAQERRRRGDGVHPVHRVDPVRVNPEYISQAAAHHPGDAERTARGRPGALDPAERRSLRRRRPRRRLVRKYHAADALQPLDKLAPPFPFAELFVPFHRLVDNLGRRGDGMARAL